MSADLTLTLDLDGIVLDVRCRGRRLERELDPKSMLHGRYWPSTVTENTRAAATRLLRGTPADVPSELVHVDQTGTDGFGIPMSLSSKPADDGTVVFGRDLRVLDAHELVGLSDSGPLVSWLRAHARQGLSLETLLLDILAPTARRLGDLWTHDACSFVDVTVGVGTLRKATRELQPSGSRHCGGPGRQLLLTAYPGEQHVLGIAMVAAMFRSEGWEVWHQDWQSDAELLRLAGAKWFAAAGFSATSEGSLPALRQTIAALRRYARNPKMLVMVGGRIFVERPELFRDVGADFTASDAGIAVRHIDRLLGAGSHKDHGG